MQFSDPNNKAKCPTCGKDVGIRDTKKAKPSFCNRVCATNMRMRGRYRGSNAGPLDRPKNMANKTKWEG